VIPYLVDRLEQLDPIMAGGADEIDANGGWIADCDAMRNALDRTPDKSRKLRRGAVNVH
jgi:hypothetical protein